MATFRSRTARVINQRGHNSNSNSHKKESEREWKSERKSNENINQNKIKHNLQVPSQVLYPDILLYLILCSVFCRSVLAQPTVLSLPLDQAQHDVQHIQYSHTPHSASSLPLQSNIPYSIHHQAYTGYACTENVARHFPPTFFCTFSSRWASREMRTALATKLQPLGWWWAAQHTAPIHAPMSITIHYH